MAKQVTRDYDEEEQGYDSEKEKKEEKKPTEPGSPKTKECSVEKGTGDSLRESKVNGDDRSLNKYDGRIIRTQMPLSVYMLVITFICLPFKHLVN